MYSCHALIKRYLYSSIIIHSMDARILQFLNRKIPTWLFFFLSAVSVLSKSKGDARYVQGKGTLLTF